MKVNKLIRSFLFLALMGSAACSNATPAPQITLLSPVPPVASDQPLYQQVTLTAVPSEVDNQTPEYKITLQTPTLAGAADPRVDAFNTQVATIITSYEDDFKNNQLPQALTNTTIATSSLDVQYQLLSPPGNILSIKFAIEGYVNGYAHPYHFNPTLNFDLEKGKTLTLANLFLPNSDYLTPISNYCANQLKQSNVGFTSDFQSGADPKPENYQNWNITSDGLAITFNEYQVAPYASGPQTVTIPYSELKNLIDPNGPLATFVK